MAYSLSLIDRLTVLRSKFLAAGARTQIGKVAIELYKTESSEEAVAKLNEELLQLARSLAVEAARLNRRRAEVQFITLATRGPKFLPSDAVSMACEELRSAINAEILTSDLSVWARDEGLLDGADDTVLEEHLQEAFEKIRPLVLLAPDWWNVEVWRWGEHHGHYGPNGDDGILPIPFPREVISYLDRVALLAAIHDSHAEGIDKISPWAEDSSDCMAWHVLKADRIPKLRQQWSNHRHKVLEFVDGVRHSLQHEGYITEADPNIEQKLRPGSNFVRRKLDVISGLHDLLVCKGRPDGCNPGTGEQNFWCGHCSYAEFPATPTEYAEIVAQELVRGYRLTQRQGRGHWDLESHFIAAHLSLNGGTGDPVEFNGHKAPCLHSAVCKWSNDAFYDLWWEVKRIGDDTLPLEETLQPLLDSRHDIFDRWAEKIGKFDYDDTNSRLSIEVETAVRNLISPQPISTAVEVSTPRESTKPFRHSRDFRTVAWFGTTYTFTASQSLAVRVLWEEWENGTPDVSDATCCAAIDHESPPASLRDQFRSNDAWGTMIVDGKTRGTHRLQQPG
jgi:hypothetical protein